jgi:hypothetical protein
MSAIPLTRIVRWHERYEPVAIVGPAKVIPVVAFPIELDDPDFQSGYSKLIGGRKGAARLGGWLSILQIAARRFPRGVLITPQGVGYNSLALSRATRLPSKLFDDLLPFLLNEIQWLEPVSHNEVAEIIDNYRQASVRAVRTRLDEANSSRFAGSGESIGA